jgi:pimeloyl-ACP methyl ester carboxylesterase
MTELNGSSGQYQTVDTHGHGLVGARSGSQTGVPPVVFLHGFGCSIETWPEDFIASIGCTRQCLSLSLPGHMPATFSGNPQDAITDDDIIVQAVREAIVALIGEPAILVGHSTGGWLALRLAARYPDEVLGVVGLSGFAVGRLGGPLGAAQSLASTDSAGQQRARRLLQGVAGNRAALSFLDDHLKTNSGEQPDGPTEQFILAFQQALQQHDMAFLTAWLRLLHRQDATPELPKITAPVLLVHGERDAIVPPSEADRIAAEIGGECALVRLQETGHFAFLEDPEKLNRIIATWLEGRRP